MTMREMERRILESTLAASGGNRTHAARLLGICPRTMRNKIREFGFHHGGTHEPEWFDTCTRFLQRYLDLASFRQTLVSANLANLDTPGYQTVDMAFQSELAWASVSNYEQPTRPMVRRVQGLIERPDGNNVSLDREGLLLSQTQLQYKRAIELIRAEFHRMLGAINDGKES